MKKLLSTITIIAILGILAAVGFFGYNKYQEVELEKSELQAKQKQLMSNSSAQKDSDVQVQNESKSTNETTNENNTTSNEKVNRNNVFDYLFAGMEQDDDSIWKKDKLVFQDPTINLETGKWEIFANNKSGSGSYVFKVTPDGNVEFYDSSGKELRLTIPVKL